MDSYISPLAAPFSFSEGDHGLLLIHGFTGSPAHMRQIGEALHARGFAVEGILLPGHGTLPQDMKNVSWQDWLLAVRTKAKEMQKKYPHFSVGGLSMGGVLSLILAQEMDVTACISLASPMRTTNRLRWAAPLLALFVPTIGWGGEVDENGLRKSKNPYDVGYRRYPTSSVHDLSVLIRKARRDLSLIHCPVLAVQSHQDKTVTADSPQIILDGISSQIKAQLWLENAPHVCTTSPEYPKIVSAMDEFLRRAENEGK